MIAFNGHHLTIGEVWQIASRQSPCALADDARPLIRRSRALVESLAAQPRAIYGINTG
ncbi:MAG: aromatic amino acid lyase, partial [Verrucomicrobia bacterium]|nr:aromatic amino acid lyase [Verrucomicrobiota bacterium]